MEYIDFKRLIDALIARPNETEWLEFKHNFHSKEEIGERISALSNSAYLCNMPFGYIGTNQRYMKPGNSQNMCNTVFLIQNLRFITKLFLFS